VVDRGTFVLFTHSAKKLLYRSFLTEPLPIESNFDVITQIALNSVLCHSFASSKSDLVGFLVKTYFYQRIIRNPSYYGMASADQAVVSDFVSELIDNAVEELVGIQAVEEHEDGMQVFPSPIGQMAKNNGVEPLTVSLLANAITAESGHRHLLRAICATAEFSVIPIRSPKLIAELMQRITDVSGDPVDPAVCSVLVFRAQMGHFLRPELTELLTVVSVAFLRVVGAAIDVAASRGWLVPTVAAIQLAQRIVQGIMFEDSELMQLPNVTREIAAQCAGAGIATIDNLRDLGSEEGGDEQCRRLLGLSEDEGQWLELCEAVNRFPIVTVQAARSGMGEVTVNIQRTIEEDETVGAVVAPRFPVQKAENWYIILTDEEKQVLGIQKVQFDRQESVQFALPEDDMQGPLNVYVLCDCYVNCDRACEVQGS
jgi:pre-mRNA-splicing helicase BRR2